VRAKLCSSEFTIAEETKCFFGTIYILEKALEILKNEFGLKIFKHILVGVWNKLKMPI
jgi:hypothetical protein